MQKPRKVEIFWDDITELSGWNSIDALTYKPNACHSVGWLIRTDKKNYYMTDCIVSENDTDPFGVVFIIPKGCVTKIKWLK